MSMPRWELGARRSWYRSRRAPRWLAYESCWRRRAFSSSPRSRVPKINERLPKEYAILQVTVPVAAVKALDIDPLAPAAVMFPIAVIPTEDGKSVIASADPVGQVWLYGELELRNVLAAVKKRLAELLAEL